MMELAGFRILFLFPRFNRGAKAGLCGVNGGSWGVRKWTRGALYHPTVSSSSQGSLQRWPSYAVALVQSRLGPAQRRSRLPRLIITCTLHMQARDQVGHGTMYSAGRKASGGWAVTPSYLAGEVDTVGTVDTEPTTATTPPDLAGPDSAIILAYAK